MLLTSTTFEIPGQHTVKSLGIVRGLTVRTRSFPVSFLGVLRTLFGGRVGNHQLKGFLTGLLT